MVLPLFNVETVLLQSKNTIAIFDINSDIFGYVEEELLFSNTLLWLDFVEANVNFHLSSTSSNLGVFLYTKTLFNRL